MAELIVRNPYTGAELAKLPWAEKAEIQATLDRATSAFEKWRKSPAWERSQLLLHAATELERRREEFAQLIRDEAGKPIRYSLAEVDRALSVLRYAAGEAQRLGGEILRLDAFPSGRPGMGIHMRFPRGVVLGITPFNFPLNLALHKIAPALACGCSIVIKPSPATPLTAIKTAELFSSAPNLVQVVLADDDAIADLTRAPEIATISFTGSARVGKLIRAQAPEKPATLELGGNAWVIVMDDVDPSQLPGIAKRITGAAFGYAGQSCISVQNVAVAKGRAKELSELIEKETLATAYGDPASPRVISGPVINSAAAKRVADQIEQASRASRQKPVTSQAREGRWAESSPIVAPTCIALAPLGQAISPAISNEPWVQEEVFGPVMTSRAFDGSLEILIAQINSSRYGLQAGVFTQNWATIETLYRELRVGGLIVNDVPTTRYDHQPYGGVKESGLGREGIRYACEEMTDSKFLALSSTVPI